MVVSRLLCCSSVSGIWVTGCPWLLRGWLLIKIWVIAMFQSYEMSCLKRRWPSRKWPRTRKVQAHGKSVECTTTPSHWHRWCGEQSASSSFQRTQSSTTAASTSTSDNHFTVIVSMADRSSSSSSTQSAACGRPQNLSTVFDSWERL